jgi:hypothetical protein
VTGTAREHWTPSVDFETVISMLTVLLSTHALTGSLTATGTVQLDAPTSEPVSVGLSSDNAAVILPNATVTVTPGQTNATFPVLTAPVADDTAVTLTATRLGGSPPGVIERSVATLTVLRPRLDGLTVDPVSVSAGQTASGTVRLTGPIPDVGVVLTVATDKPLAAHVPGSPLTLASGQASTTFAITTEQSDTNFPVTIVVILRLAATSQLETLASTLTVGDKLKELKESKERKDKEKDPKDKDKDIKEGKDKDGKDLKDKDTSKEIKDKDKEQKDKDKDVKEKEHKDKDKDVKEKEHKDKDKDVKEKEHKDKDKDKEGKEKEHKEKDIKEGKDKDGKEIKDKELKEKEGKDQKDKDKETDKEHLKDGKEKESKDQEGLGFRPSRRGQAPATIDASDPLAMFHWLTSRLDELEERLVGARAFIRPEQRPEVGRKAIDQADGDGRDS